MVHEHLAHLKLDRRLARRRGWVAPEDLAQELSKLPDVADKVQPPEAEPAPEGAASEGEGGA
jgi:hypothetical protein